MDATLQARLGEVVLLAGIGLFALGGVIVLLGTPIDYSLAALGAVALLFVGVGSAMKQRAARAGATER